MQWKTFTTLWADNESRRYAKREGFNREQLYFDYLHFHKHDDVYLGRAKRELSWYNSSRPYYRVYPCVIEMAKDIRMDAPVRWGMLPDITTCMSFKDDILKKNYIDVEPNVWAMCRDNTVKSSMKMQEPFIAVPRCDLTHEEIVAAFEPNFWENNLKQVEGATQKDLEKILRGFHSTEFTQSLLIETPKDNDIPSMLLSVSIQERNQYTATLCYNDGKDEDGDNAFMTHNLRFDGSAITIGEIVQEARTEREKQILKLVSLIFMFTDPSLDLMERIVLNKDKGKKVTPKILERAEKATGRGWTIGRKLDELPRKGRPHWGIRWCKPDHEGEVIESWDGVAPESRQGCVPKLRPIRGANEDFYRKVPTGHKD